MLKIYDRLVSIDQPSSTDGQSGGGSTRGHQVDVVLDDRSHNFMWKLKDADLIGYPVIVLLGRAWKTQGKCEVQCRRLDKLRTEVALEDLPAFVASLLQRL